MQNARLDAREKALREAQEIVKAEMESRERKIRDIDEKIVAKEKRF